MEENKNLYSRTEQIASTVNQSHPDVGRGLVGVIRNLLSKAFSGQLPLAESLLNHNSGILARLHGIYDESPELMDALLDCTRYYYQLGKTTRGIPLAERALELAERAADTPRIRVASNVLGACYRDTGNIGMSFTRLLGALDAARELDDAVQINAVLANIGTALQTAGLYDSAISCHQKVLAAVRSATDRQSIEHQFQALGNLVFCAQRVGKTELITCSIDALDAMSATAVIGEVAQSTSELFVIQALLATGYADQAYQRGIAMQSRHRGSSNQRIQLLSAMALGLAETRTQRIDVGVTRLMQTYDQCKAANLYYDDALRSLIDGHFAARDNSTALKYVDELTAYIKRTQTSRLHEQLVLAARGEMTVDK
jgi:tetratricopeptide (TPR) repeat protein